MAEIVSVIALAHAPGATGWLDKAPKAEQDALLAGYAEMGRRIPMGRVGTAQEFANMVLFLASDAGSYIAGTAINIDGGACPVV